MAFRRDEKGNKGLSFRLGTVRHIPKFRTNTYRQGTRRYCRRIVHCNECRSMMKRTKQWSVAQKSVRGLLKLYKCEKGHELWGM